MKIRLFTLHFSPETGKFDDSALKEFLEDKDVSTVYSNPFMHGDRPYWAVLVKYSDKEKKLSAATAGDNRDPQTKRNDHIDAPANRDIAEKSNGTHAFQPRRDDSCADGGSPRTTNGTPVLSSTSTLPLPMTGSSPSIDPAKRGLYENLRNWRFNLARNRNVPLYMICNNKEIEAIVRALPADLSALNAIREVRPSVIKQFGPDLLANLRA